MKIFSELVDHGQFEYLTEAAENKPKIYKMRGIMMEASTKNRNGRVYPNELLEREIERYNEEKISKRRSFGNCDHPSQAVIKLADASHIITELHYDRGNQCGIGELEVLDTPTGKILKVLMDANCQIAVSTRGIGSLGEGNVVGEDYKLLAIDAVSDPSANRAVMENVFESKDYIINEHGDIVEMAVSQLEKDLSKHGSKQLAEDLSKFISNLRKRI